MRIHRDTTFLADRDRGATAAVGNFDGVHRGHQAILRIAAEAADAPLGAVTFEQPEPDRLVVSVRMQPGADGSDNFLRFSYTRASAE